MLIGKKKLEKKGSQKKYRPRVRVKENIKSKK